MTAEEIFEESYIPHSFKQIIAPAGGDFLFRCFAFWLECSEDAQCEMREKLVAELIKDPC